MEHRFIEYLYGTFSKLVEKYGFHKSTELIDEQSYSVEYRSNNFVIKLEKYRREFYVTLYKTGYSNKGVNLFNLLKFLKKASSDVPMSKYFKEEKDMEECYKKQLNYISNTIYDNFIAINDFFKSGNYESKLMDIEKFMLNKYPELFKRLD